MAENPSVLASIAIMNKDLANGRDDVDPLAYTHNKLIKKQLDKARKKAWSSIREHPEIQRLIQEAKQREIDKKAKTKETSIRNTNREAQKLLNRKNK